jgi:hypothetical protein
MAIIFKYENTSNNKGVLHHSPCIPIYIKDSKGKLYRFIALVDSGADTTIVPKDFAQMLGLKESPYEDYTAGIGGKVNVRSSNLTYVVKGPRERYTINAPCLVLQDLNSSIPIILGRNSFFEHFHVTFRQDQKKIVLKKINPKNTN